MLVLARRGFVRRFLILFALLVASTGAVGLPRTAAADDPFCPVMNEGHDMRNAGCWSWRSSYVLDMGRYNLVGYQDLWRYHAMYNSRGFSDNWLWYAPATQRTFVPGPDSGVRWASCGRVGPGDYADHEVDGNDNDGSATGLCTDQILWPHETNKTLLQFFNNHTVTLNVFQFGGAFIARECGNFSVAPSENPVPKISGAKYRDANRNGQRDAGEAGLAGWEIKLIRDSSDLVPAQGTGHVLTTTTDANGNYSFDLWRQGPGNYRVVETQQDGWVQTAGPGTVHVPFGAGSHDYKGNDLGNVEQRADVVKVDWDVVAPPSRIDAGVPTTLTVRATLTNNGPAPEVDVTDTMVADAQDDCVVRPAQQAVTRRLRRGEVTVVDFDVEVTCEDPSFHTFVFGNTVAPVAPIEDPDTTNNARSTSVTIPVFDDSDARLDGAALDCPARIDVAMAFTCTGTATLANTGPYGATGTDVAFSLTPPADCTVADGPARKVEDVAVPADGTVPVTTSWLVTCADRSYHPFTMDAVATLDHIHVEDHVPANDSASAADLVEVFEESDLSITEPTRIACGGRLPTITSFGCDVRVTVANAGPATGVLTTTTTTLSAPDDCTVTPQALVGPATLDAGEAETLTFHYDVTCTKPVLHTLLAEAVIAAAEPHADDRDPGNNTGRVRWVPMDNKPTSDPSAVNIGKEGVVPVAILSTPEFDAFTEVDQASLRWGVTGFEESLVGCGGAAEDRNADSYADLVCRFDTQAAQLTCATTEAILTGYLADGTPLESQDPVKVTGCKK